MRALFVHAAPRQRSDKLLSALRERLELVVPKMPSPDAPRPAEWVEALTPRIKDQRYVIGHALGGQVALHCLSKLANKDHLRAR